ncbi:MAG TPA: nitroreductase [Ramlibacter sp.]|uniref:nitroreductase n=1 Tax=Ramlibacter sp. TaxID=1917967 RepID=UPI002B6B3B93|nr:nitroreductase [Ramlibacter sp.]HVZ45777.1 nitroreductase [Ramlibacter sp.]
MHAIAKSTAKDTADMNDTERLDALFSERYSCRGYLPRPVPEADLRRIVEIAQKTASWCNSQPWQVYILSGSAKDRFRDGLLRYRQDHDSKPDIDFPREYVGVYQERRRECGFQLYESVGVARGDRVASAKQAEENFKLFGAPHVAIVTTPEALGTYGAVDCGAWVANFMLIARSMGVASIAQAALAGQSAYIREFLQLPAERLIVCGISFGYPDSDHPANRFRTRRASIGQAVQFIEA